MTELRKKVKKYLQENKEFIKIRSIAVLSEVSYAKLYGFVNDSMYRDLIDSEVNAIDAVLVRIYNYEKFD